MASLKGYAEKISKKLYRKAKDAELGDPEHQAFGAPLIASPQVYVYGKQAERKEKAEREIQIAAELKEKLDAAEMRSEEQARRRRRRVQRIYGGQTTGVGNASVRRAALEAKSTTGAG